MSPGFIKLATSNLLVAENSGELLVSVVRVNGSDGLATVNYSIIAGSANEGEDYSASPLIGVLEFADGETEQFIPITIKDNQLVETDETFSVLIGEPTGAQLDEPRTATITIQDDDLGTEPTISFDQTQFSVNESGGQATITLVKQGTVNSQVSVDFTTIDNYARANSAYPDYVPVTQTIVFAPEETSKTITVEIINDNIPEHNDSLNLSLSNPVGIQLGIQNKARLTIEDDDGLLSPGFSKELVVDGLVVPTDFEWISDHQMIITQQNGKVLLFDERTGVLSDFLDIRNKVNVAGQRGLLSLAVHPDFPNNPYIYLGYAYDSPRQVADNGRDRRGRRDTLLVRMEADPNTNYTTAIPESEVVLMTVPKANSFHASAGLAFGLDGSLFWAHGDGAVVGSILNNPEDFARLDYPFGKLFRIDPMTGKGYEDNPFFTGDVNDIESKVYSLGSRNPWRIAVHPETGEPFIGDVGLASWEEINTGRGANFGWPFFEGGYIDGQGETLPIPEYLNDPRYQDIYADNSDVTPPTYAIPHEFGNSITLGEFYTKSLYPELYHGGLIVGDFGSGNLDILKFKEDGSIDTSLLLANVERMTNILVGPDGSIYTSSLSFTSGSQIYKLAYETPNLILDGTPYSDIFIGSPGNDILNGLRGDDQLIGAGGIDIINGNSGNDILDARDEISLIPSDDLVMLLELNEANGSFTPDTSSFGGDNPGELINGTIIDPVLGTAKFDGIDDAIHIANTPDINRKTVAERTIALWFKADDVLSDEAQVLYQQGGGFRGLNVYLQGGNLYVGAWNGDYSWNTYLSTPEIDSQTWHHVSLVLNTEPGNNTLQVAGLKAYLDGEKFGEGLATEITPHGNFIGIGANNDGTRFHESSMGTTAFGGQMDDIRVYNSVLADETIAQLAAPRLWPEALVMNLELDEANGNFTPDTSSFGEDNPGELINGTIIDSVSGTAKFDGIDDAIHIANTPDINGRTVAERTITLQFKANDVFSNEKQVLYEEGGSFRGLNVYLQGGNLYVGAWNGDYSWNTYLSTSDIDSQTWHQVSLVLNAEPGNNTAQEGALKAYLDGEKFGEGLATEITPHGNFIGIGANNDGTRFHDGERPETEAKAFAGEMDDIRVYNSVSVDQAIDQLAVPLAVDQLDDSPVDQLDGGSGNDILYAGQYSSELTGRTGADQFWVVNDGLLPQKAHIITDFQLERDLIGIEGLGISSSDLAMTQLGDSVLIEAVNAEIALLSGIEAAELNSSHFIFA